MPEETTATETVETQELKQEPAAETVAEVEGETAEAKAERIAKELEGAQKRISELNKENEKRRLAEKAAAEEKLAEEGKLQELVELRQKERDEVTGERDAQAEKLNRYNEILSADIEKRVKEWPDEVKSLIPNGDGVDALARLERITELEPLAQKLMSTPARPGNGAGPVPSGGVSAEVLKEAQQAQGGFIRNTF